MTAHLKAEIARVQERRMHYESLRNMRVFEVEPTIQGATYDLIFAQGALDQDDKALISEALEKLARWI
jgi:hypothetical protein